MRSKPRFTENVLWQSAQMNLWTPPNFVALTPNFFRFLEWQNSHSETLTGSITMSALTACLTFCENSTAKMCLHFDVPIDAVRA